MTNKGILAELKKSYEYLQDIRENGCQDHCNGQMGSNIDKLKVAINNVIEIYEEFYNTLDTEELRVKQLEKTEDERVYIPSDISYDYEYYNWDTHEETIFTCLDIDYYWYNDEEFLNN